MKTWDDNRQAINQLWPMAKFTDEEKRLWSEDLSGLEHDVLYDAIRNVKRNHDTLYPQLKWVLDSYRELLAAKKHASRPKGQAEPKLKLSIQDEEDRRLADDLIALVEVSVSSDFEQVEEKVLDYLPKMHASSAVSVLNYARCRLLGATLSFSSVTRSGELKPLSQRKLA